VIQSTLDQNLLISKLKADLRCLMEKGRVYPLGSGELIAWGVRFFFVADDGLCYQHVTRKMQPRGTRRTIPWSEMMKVEALEDDSIFLETSVGKKYYLKIRNAKRPAVEAWHWATHLCHLSQLLGNELTGHVAQVAYRAQGYQPPAIGPLPSKARASVAQKGQVPGYAATIPEDAALPTGGGALAAPGVTPTRSPGSTLPKGGVSSESPADSTETDEGEETAEEAQRRQQWIEYYVSIGQFKEAEEIGWDLLYPEDPRQQRQSSAGAEPSPLYAANYGAGGKEAAKDGGKRGSGLGLFGRGKKAEAAAGEGPETPKGSQMAWLESGVEKGVAGIITPSSGGGTGPNTGPQTRQVTPPG